MQMLLKRECAGISATLEVRLTNKERLALVEKLKKLSDEAISLADECEACDLIIYLVAGDSKKLRTG